MPCRVSAALFIRQRIRRFLTLQDSSKWFQFRLNPESLEFLNQERWGM
jgi:hypothetical protein